MKIFGRKGDAARPGPGETYAALRQQVYFSGQDVIMQIRLAEAA